MVSLNGGWCFRSNLSLGEGQKKTGRVVKKITGKEQQEIRFPAKVTMQMELRGGKGEVKSRQEGGKRHPRIVTVQKDGVPKCVQQKPVGKKRGCQYIPGRRQKDQTRLGPKFKNRNNRRPSRGQTRSHQEA